MPSVIGQGATASYGGTPIVKIKSISWPDMKSAPVDTTSTASNYFTESEPGMTTTGNIVIVAGFTVDLLNDLVDMKINQTVQTWALGGSDQANCDFSSEGWLESMPFMFNNQSQETEVTITVVCTGLPNYGGGS